MNQQTDFARGGRGAYGRGRGGSQNMNNNNNTNTSNNSNAYRGGGGTSTTNANDTSIPMMGTHRRTYNAAANTGPSSNPQPAASSSAAAGVFAANNNNSNNTALPPAPNNPSYHHQNNHHHHQHHGQSYAGSGGRGRGGMGDGYGGRGGTNTPPPQQHQHQQQGLYGPSYHAGGGGGAPQTQHNATPSRTSAIPSRGVGAFGGQSNSAPTPTTTTTTMRATHTATNMTMPAAGGSMEGGGGLRGVVASSSSSATIPGAGATHQSTSSTTSATTAASSASGENVLAVMDMGLDFRSYQGICDPTTGRPVVGNIVTFAAEKVPDVFQPTVGLLVTMLHMYSVSRSSEAAHVWISAYETVQNLFIEQCHRQQQQAGPSGGVTSLTGSFSSQPSSAGGAAVRGGAVLDSAAQQQGLRESTALRHAEEAVRVITQYESNHGPHNHPDHRLCERLLVLLDHQSGVRAGGGPGGQQLPSQRRVPQAPKATFCNLHLSDHKCHQDFSCNQVHLHQVGSVKHRIEYHCRLVQCLLGNRMEPEEVDQRLRDSLFYAKFGNKVTLRCTDGSWVQFFKTLYTPTRLDLALRKTLIGTVKLQDGGGGVGGGRQQHQGSKPMDLSTPEAEVKAYLDESCREVYTALEQKLKEQQAAQQEAELAATAAKAQQVAAAAYARKQQQPTTAATVGVAEGELAATGVNASGGQGTEAAPTGTGVMQILTTSMAATNNAAAVGSKSGKGGISASTATTTTASAPSGPQQVILATNVHNLPSSAAIAAVGGTTTIGKLIGTPDTNLSPSGGQNFKLTPSNMIPWASSVDSNIPAAMIPPSSATVASKAGGVSASPSVSPQSQQMLAYRNQFKGGDDDDDEDDDNHCLVREYVRLTGISQKQQRANEALLSALQVGNGSSGASNGQSISAPVTPESFTPLMHEVQMRRFASESTADGDWTR